MPDINDIFPFLQPPGISDNSGQSAPQPAPTGIPSLAAAQAPAQAPTQAPQSPSQNPGLDELLKNLNNPVFRQSPADEYHQFINKIYYGNKDGSEPTKKQKILRPIEDMLLGTIGYQRPELAMLPAAERAYQEQTGRAAQQTGIERWLGMIFNQQQGLGIKKEVADTGVYKASLTAQENQARDRARDLRNTIEQTYREAAAKHLSAEDSELAVRQKFQEFQMQNPGNPLQYAEVLQKAANAGDPTAMDDLKTILPIMAGFGAAKQPILNLGATTNSTQTTDQKGNTVTNTSNQRQLAYPGGGLLQMLSQMMSGKPATATNNIGMPIGGGGIPGLPQANPAATPQANPAGIPNIPQTQPQPNFRNPVNLPGMHQLDYKDTNQDATDSRFTYQGGNNTKARDDWQADQKTRGQLLNLNRAFENASASLAQDLINARANGNNNFTGFLNGNPMLQKFRADFADINPEEAMAKGDFFNTTMNRARNAVKGAGRMNIPEIKMASTTTGNQQERAQNAILQAADASMKAGAQRLFDNGNVTQQDLPVITKAINHELYRIKNGQISTVRPIEDVIKDETTRITIYKNGKTDSVPARQLDAAKAQGWSTDKPQGK